LGRCGKRCQVRFQSILHCSRILERCLICLAYSTKYLYCLLLRQPYLCTYGFLFLFHEQPKRNSHIYRSLKLTRNAMRRKLLCIAVQPRRMWIQATSPSRVKFLRRAHGKLLLTLGAPSEVSVFSSGSCYPYMYRTRPIHASSGVSFIVTYLCNVRL
jgi:hypothetical protein